MMEGLRLRLACRIKLGIRFSTKSSIVPVVKTKGKGSEAHNWPRRTGVLGKQERDVGVFERHVKVSSITLNVPVGVRHNMLLMSRWNNRFGIILGYESTALGKF